MSSVHLVRFDAKEQPAADSGQPDSILAGTPLTTTRNFYSGANDHFFSGIWESTVGKWEISYTEHEFVHMLEGKAILTAADGTAETFEAGDSFVVPAGFEGTWESVDPVKKLYAIYEA